MMPVTSLASFKRFLAEPGATVQVVRNDWTNTEIHGNTGRYTLTPKPGYFDQKQVEKLQSNAVKFSNGGWLAFPKASNVRFENGDTVILDMKQDGSFAEVLVYKLTVATS